MGVKIQGETEVTAVGYVESPYRTVRDILDDVVDGNADLQEDHPKYVYDSKVYKVTITVELV